MYMWVYDMTVSKNDNRGNSKTEERNKEFKRKEGRKGVNKKREEVNKRLRKEEGKKEMIEGRKGA